MNEYDSALEPDEIQEHKEILRIMDESSMVPRQFWFWFISSGGTLLDGVSIMMIGISLHFLSDKLSPLWMGLIGTALVLGAVFGSNLGGKISDTKGRKKILILNMAIIMSGAALSAFSASNLMLLIGQLIIGIGIGSDFAVSGTYVAEITPRKFRSRLMVGTITFQSIGLILAALLSLATLEIVTSPQIWRYLFAIETLLALIFFIFRFSLFESPRWLMSNGKNNEAVKIIAEFYSLKEKELKKFADSAKNKIHKVILPLKTKSSKEYGILFSKAYIKRTILASVPWFLMDIATYGVGLFTPVILANLIKSSPAESPHLQAINNIIGTTGIDLFLLFGFLSAFWLVPIVGKIKMQVIGFAGMFAGMSILFIASYFNIIGKEHTLLIFTGFVIFNLLMNAGPNATTFAMAPELFPTQLRSTASGFAAGFAKIGAALGIFIFPIIKNDFGVPVLLAGLAFVSLLALFITIIYSQKIKEDAALETYHR